MLHKNAFGQFQFKKSGIQARILKDCKYTFQEVLVPKLHRGDVHGHRTQAQARIQPSLGLLARFMQDPVADRQNQAAVLRYGNKLCRRDSSSNGMRPAYQCFRAGNLSCSQIDLGLVVQREFLPFQGAPQALFDELPLYGSDVHGWLEKLIALPSVFLCLVHRGIRVLDECLGIQTVVWIDTQADACGDVKIVPVDRVSLRHRLQHSSRRNGSIFRLVHF